MVVAESHPYNIRRARQHVPSKKESCWVTTTRLSPCIPIKKIEIKTVLPSNLNLYKPVDVVATATVPASELPNSGEGRNGVLPSCRKCGATENQTSYLFFTLTERSRKENREIPEADSCFSPFFVPALQPF